MAKFLSTEQAFIVDQHADQFYDEAPRPLSNSLVWQPSASVGLPRKSSSSSRTSYYQSADSFISSRSSVISNGTGFTYHTEFEAIPASTRSSWEFHRYKRPLSVVSYAQSFRPNCLPPRVFQQLPREVYACILQQLEVVHFGKGAPGCTTCYLKDLCNLSLTSRAFDKATRVQIYSKLYIPPYENNESRKLSRWKSPSRLKLLRKTLRERSALAKLVKEIRAPELQYIYLQIGHKERQELLDNLASIVMACPNLEKLVGFHWTYNHDFDRLTHALSTRTKLKERAWILRSKDYSRERVDRAELYPGPTELFLSHHDNSANLETLFLHASHAQTAGTMDYRAFVAPLRKLPSLKHLHLSNFDANDFNDRTLQGLPSNLQSLRIEELPGVTDAGLVRFANSPAAVSLKRLHFIRQEIIALPVIFAFFINLQHLTTFTLLQDTSPTLLPGESVSLPPLASKSLEFLHWDILVPGPATNLVAAAIGAGFFPSLRRIRAPCDHEGLLQNLCRPVASLLHDSDTYDYVPPAEDGSDDDHYTRDLPSARRAAQRRIEGAADVRSTAMKIVVDDEDGVVQHTYTIKGWMGTVGSKIEYWLKPDVEGREAEAVIEVDEVMRPNRVGGDGGTASDGDGGYCTGPMGRGNWASSKRRASHWGGNVGHAPRVGWRITELSDYF
ncbi:hypothetical protein K490DRAFT_68227 [Saccharata proteae CBS 121410]|uniref:Uncharacterized protein n=1 Tax=Saccharata proteae CBS 121410 TaxID=1314787 RepID=A0A9P4HQD8_9PEZI|nr:hypothetical protein K490DRAFT_68227 [Saccharata proteae CBS 121410]